MTNQNSTSNKFGIEDDLEEELRKNLLKLLHEQIDKLPDRVRDRIREFIVSTKGKMLRPILVVASADFLGANDQQIKQAMISAVSVELLHNFTLIHDDLLDGAPLRRGKKSYHIRHGMELAIHDGDILHSYALSFVKDHEALRLIIDISNDVGKGNGIELEDRLDHNYSFTLDHVITILKLKTAIVFYGCVALAGIAAQKQKITEALEEIITNAGIAFQIQDDILDIIGDQETFGKQSYWDIQESKRNLFLLFALQDEHADRLKKIYNKPVGEKSKEDIKFVLTAFEKHIDKVLEVRDKYFESCIEGLDQKIEQAESNPEQQYLVKLYEFLKELIIYICTRDK